MNRAEGDSTGTGEAASPELSLPFTPTTGRSRPVFAGMPPTAAFPALSPTAAIRALPGLGAWSLECRRKTLRGVLRAWLLKSRKPVR